MYSDISLNLVLAMVVLAVYLEIRTSEKHFLTMLLEIVIQPKITSEQSLYLIFIAIVLVV